MGQAPSQFTIDRVRYDPEPWTGNKGPMVTAELYIRGHEHKLKCHHEASRPKLEGGQEVDGWLNADKGTFNWARPKGESRGSVGASSGGSRSEADRSHSIERQVAAYAASYMACASGGDAPTMIANWEAMADEVIRWIQRAPESAPAPASQPQQEISADTEGLEPAAVGNGKSDDDDSIPF